MDQDWELLHNSEPEFLINPSEPSHASSDYYTIETESIIRPEYFASDGVTVDEEEVGSVVSDNPSWVDPNNVVFRKTSCEEFWSDASSDASGGSHKNQNFDVGIEGIGEILHLEAKNDDVHEVWSDTEVEAGGGSDGGGDGEAVEEEEEKSVVKTLGEGNKEEGMVWWKVPFEILKFCLFKVNPGWSIAMAAAVVGILIMRRRLYRMKRKTRRVPLEITVEDKKVSQFMKNAARLNEAFSVVKRVPMIRPMLPAPGLTPWPVISLR